jgi:glycogen synthase
MKKSGGVPALQLRVLLFGPYPPPHGGVETNVVAIRDFLFLSQINCQVINLTRHRKTEGNGVYYPRGVLDVLRLLLKLQADIIHVHIGGNVTWRLLGLGFVCSLLPDRKVVLTLHSGGYPSSPAGQAARSGSLRGFIFRRFDGLVGVNQEIIETFVRFGVPRKKTRLILPFVPPDPVPGGSLPETIRVFFESHKPVLLTVSGLEPEYDLPLQINALGSFREEHPKAGLVIIGVGSLEAETRSRIQAQPYADHILLAGDVPHDVVLRAMSLADVFLRTTLYDGDSISVREALHFGLPVIASDNGMRPDGVHLIPPGDQAALETVLVSLLKKNGDAQRMSTQRRRDENSLSAVLEFYEELSGRTNSEVAWPN